MLALVGVSFYCPLELARHEWKPLLSELGSQEKTNLGGMLHLHMIKSSPSCGALATPSPTVGRVGHEWRHPPTHTLNASQPIFWLCYDFYPKLAVSHTRKGSQDYPLTLRNQSTKQDSSKRAQHQLSLQKNNFFSNFVDLFWLCWFFIVHRLSLVAGRGDDSVAVHGLLTTVVSLVAEQGF